MSVIGRTSGVLADMRHRHTDVLPMNQLINGQSATGLFLLSPNGKSHALCCPYLEIINTTDDTIQTIKEGSELLVPPPGKYPSRSIR